MCSFKGWQWLFYKSVMVVGVHKKVKVYVYWNFYEEKKSGYEFQT